MLHTASDTFWILVYSELCLFRYIQAYTSIVTIIKTLTHIESLLRHIQVYSEACVNLTIFPVLAPEKYSKPRETLTQHI